MTTQAYITQALQGLEQEVLTLLEDGTLPLPIKDAKLLLCLQKKRILTQTLEDILYLEKHPPEEKMGCSMHTHKEG